MRRVWSYSMLELGARYRVSYGDIELAEVFWAQSPLQPSLTMARIVDGLNAVAGPQPSRTWSWGPEWSPGRHSLLHNGVEVGEWGWLRRVRNPEMWQARVLDGLNRVVGAHLPPPEPAPTVHALRGVA